MKILALLILVNTSYAQTITDDNLLEQQAAHEEATIAIEEAIQENNHALQVSEQMKQRLEEARLKSR